MPGRISSAVQLLDLLELLPLTDVEDNIWTLLPVDGRRHLRLACRQSQRLADHLITCDIRINVTQDLEQPQEAQQRRLAFLSRLPRLKSAWLTDWPHKPAFLVALRQLADATRGGLTELILGDWQLSVTGVAAVRLAFPRLLKLEVTLTRAHTEHRPLPQWAPEWELLGPLFDPLHDSSLTQLTLHQGALASADTVCSLGGLTRLRHLVLRLGTLCVAALPPLAGLLLLEHCDVYGEDVEGEFGAAALPCFMSTHLTLLHLDNMTRWEHTPYVAGSASEAADAVQQLVRLTRLRCLDVAQFVLTPLALDAVRALTQLTRLSVCGTDLPWERAAVVAAGGHLPLLQHLWTFSVRPSELLQLLQPLRPLPSLTELYGHGRDGSLMLETHCAGAGADAADADAADAVTQAAALRAVAQCLAAAPRLVLQPALQVCGGDGMRCLSLHQLVEALQPLAGRFTDVTLQDMPLPFSQPWELLASLLPKLTRLRLDACDVTHLLPVVLHLTALERLWLCECSGLGGAEWRLLAVLRPGRAVEVTVRPPLEPALVAACRQLQSDGLVEGCITFLDGVESEDDEGEGEGGDVAQG